MKAVVLDVRAHKDTIGSEAAFMIKLGCIEQDEILRSETILSSTYYSHYYYYPLLHHRSLLSTQSDDKREKNRLF